MVLLTIILPLGTFAQLTGNKFIPGDYATVTLAAADLNAQGVGAGGVTFNIAAGYTETLASRIDITATGTLANPIVFQKDPATSGANPIISAYTGIAIATSAAMDGMIALVGSDYVTFNGINLTDPNTLSNTTMMEYGYGLFKASATDGASNNTITNCVITLNRNNFTAPTSGPAFQGSNGIAVLACTQTAMQTAITVSAASGASSNNKFYANTIQNVNCGITLSGYAAASPYTLADTGNDIGGTSAGTGNTIINFGGGTAATTACAAVFVKDQWSFNISYNTVDNNVGGSGNPGGNHVQTNRGIFANASSVGASATINNNIITIRGGTNSTAIDWAIDCEMAQSGNASGNTISINNNTISAIKATTSSVAFTAIWVQSAPATMNINGNTISNFTYAGTSTSTTDVGVIRSGLAGIGTLNITNNNISGVVSTGATGSIFCISNSGSVTTAANITGNNINGVNMTGATTKTLNVLVNSAAANTSTVTISNNNFQGITHVGSGTLVLLTGTGTPLNQTISGNTFTNLSIASTGGINLIAHSYTVPSGGTQTITNNSIVTAFTKTGAGGTVNCMTSGASTIAASSVAHTNNNFSNITVTGATTLNGISSTDGLSTSSVNRTVSGNTFNNWTGGTSAITVMSYAYWGGTTSNITSNTITNITGQGAITGINLGSSANNANPLSVSSNTINNLTSTGTGGAVNGITSTNSSPAVNISGNTIHTLSSTGAVAINGINIGGAGTTNVFRNKIYNLSGNNASTTVNGINVSAGTTINLYNNLVGDLRATVANAAIPLSGINIAGGTTTNLYFNTVYLNATSSGALFGSTAINASSTPTLTLRNNIFVNTSTPNGATGYTTAYRRSSTTITTYGLTSNNNLFYAGTPGTNNLIHFDGTNSFQTIAAYKAMTVPGTLAPRDNFSFSENLSASFMSTTGSDPNFLNLTGATTQCESGGVTISSPAITNDYNNNTRNVTTPDVGAWEFAGITPAPQITGVSITPGGNQCVAVSPLVSATITSNVGTVTGGVLNYTYNGVVQSPLTMTNTTGNIWEATIPAAVTPTNASVSWSIVATNSVPLTATFNGTTYNDDPLLGASGLITASVNPICSGSPTTLTASIIRTGTSAVGAGGTTLTNSYVDPFYSLWSNTHNQYLITAAELNAAGIYGGNISSLGVQITSGTLSLTDVSIKMANTSATNVSAFLTPTFTTVYSAASWTRSIGLNTFLFSTPFNWDGTSNVVIEFCHGNSASSATMNSSVLADATTYVSTIHVNKSLASAGAATCADFTSGLVTFSQRPRFTFSAYVSQPSSTFLWSNGSTINPTVVSPGTTTGYTCDLSVFGCSITSPTFTVNVNPLPSAPSATNSTQCGPGIPGASVVATSGVNGTGQLYWYSAPTNGTLLQGPPLSPAVSTYYSNDFTSSTLTNAAISGAASIASGVLTLHPALTSQQGGLTVNPSGINSTAFQVDLDLTLTATGTQIADGFSYSFADDAIATATSPTAEHGTGSKLKLGFFTFNAANGSDGKGIYLMYNCTTLSGYTSATPGVLAYSSNVSWIPVAAGSLTNHVTITINAAGQATVMLGATTIFSNVQLPAGWLSSNKSTWKHVFSSRSGGVAGGFGMDNLVIQANTIAAGTGTYLSAVSNTTDFYVSELGVNGCESPRTQVTATVTFGDPVTAEAKVAGSPVTSVCTATPFDLSTLQTGTTNNYTYTWTASPAVGSGITGSVSGGTSLSPTVVPVTPTIAGTYVYTVSYTDGVCSGSSTVTVIAAALPTNVTASASSNTFCGSGTFNLSATGNGSGGAILAANMEVFPLTQFTVNNTSGTYTAVQSTTYFTEGTSSLRFNTTNTSANGNLALNSNINLSLYTTAQLTFKQMCLMEGPTTSFDYGYVEYSVDGGTNWITFPTSSYVGSATLFNSAVSYSTRSYADWITNFNSSAALPNNSLWKTETINIPAAALASSQFRIRFRYTTDVSTNYYGWMIDDVKITATTPANFSWSSSPAGFTSLLQNPTGVTATATTTYTVIASNAAGCTTTAATTVTINPLPSAPTASAPSTQCGYGIPTVSVTSTTGAPSPVFYWYSAPTGGTLLQTGTSSTYTSYILTSTSFYVSELLNGCESVRTQVDANVTQPDSISITSFSATCLGTANTFNIVQTGTTNTYAYTWSATPLAGSGLTGTPSGTSEVFTPTATGSYLYTVIGYDAGNNCTVIDTQSVVVYTGLSGTVSATQITSCVNPTGLITASVSGAGTVVNNDFSSSTLPSYMTISGNALITGGRLRLTDAVNSQAGGVLIQNTTGLASNDFQIDFDFITTSGGVAPADGLSYSYGDDVLIYPPGSSVDGQNLPGPWAENGSGTKLKLSFDAINNTGGCGAISGVANGNVAGVYLMYNLNQNSQTTTCPGVLYYSNDVSWRATPTTGATTHVTIKINALGQVSMLLNNVLVVNNVQLPASYLTADKSNWKHAFAARTGGLNEGHFIDNLIIQYNNFYEYSINGGTSWSTVNPIIPPAPGTYSVDARYVSVPGCTANLGSVTINPLSFTTTSTASTICGYSPAQPTLGFTPAFTAGATYQWESSPAGANTWSPIVGETGSTYTPLAGTILFDTDFRCVISCGGIPITGSPSTPYTISVVAPVISTTTPASRCGFGSVTLNATGTGTDLFWYAASTGGTSIGNGASFPTPQINTTTSYWVSSSTAGCESPRTEVVATVTAPPTATVSPNVTFCEGGSTTLTVSSPNDPNYSYVWTPAGFNGASYTVTPSSTTVYTLTATDTTTGANAGCVDVKQVTVTVNPAPVFTVSTTTPSVCNGDTASILATVTAPLPTNYNLTSIPFSPVVPTGTVTVLADAGVAVTTQTISSLDDGTWTNLPLPSGFAFNYYGSTPTQFNVSTNGFMTLGAAITSASCCSGQSIPNAATPNDYLALSHEDFLLSTSGTIDYFTNGVAPNRKFVVRFTNVPRFGGTGAPTTGQIVLNETSNTIEFHVTSVTTASGDATTMGIENGTGTQAVVVSGRNSTSPWTATNEGWLFTLPSAATLNWTGQNIIGSNTTAAIQANPSTSGYYAVVVTNPLTGCTKTDSVLVNASLNPSPVITPGDTALCFPGSIYLHVNDTGAFVGGYPAGTQYNWINITGGFVPDLDSINSLNGSTYQVIVKLPSGCADTSSIRTVLTRAVAVVDNITNSSCVGAGSISATVTSGLPPFNFVWSTDLAQTNVIRNITQSGNVDVLPNLTAGTYYLSIADSAGSPVSCNSGVLTYTVTGTGAIIANASVVQGISCNGVNDGSVTVSATGGSGTLSYLWSNAQTTQTISGLLAGNYSVIVSDGSGCADTADVTLVDPALLGMTFTTTPETSAGASDGTVTGIVTGGTSPYTFIWLDSLGINVIGNGNNPETGFPAGLYYGVVTDNNGCQFADTFRIELNTVTNATVNITAFIEGYYNGTGGLVAALSNSGVGASATECDTIYVELRDQISPTTVLASGTAVLSTSGQASFTFPGSVIGQNGYIAVFHRNAVQTWSDIITFSATTNYDFTTAASQAYNGNQREVAPGVWAFYSGDLSPQDEFIDILDQGVIDNDIFNFAGGYVVSDLSGDGFVDIVDQSIVDNNIFNFIGSSHP